MVDVRAVISSFFIMLEEDTYVLIRIESLVALVTVMFLVMFIMDFYRCRSRSSMVTTVLKTVDDMSDHIVFYLLGAMQSASFNNQLFPVWAIVLVSFRASLGYLSEYDRQQLSEVSNVIKFLGVGFINATRGLEFKRPLWSLWAILLLRSMYRCFAHNMAITSLWHGRSSEFLPDYMHAGTHDYLVYGESKQKVKLNMPQYILCLDITDPESLITLDRILERQGPLLTSSNNQRNKFQDLSLAFALSRLLRCRLEDVTLPLESVDRTWDLVKREIFGVQQGGGGGGGGGNSGGGGTHGKGGSSRGSGGGGGGGSGSSRGGGTGGSCGGVEAKSVPKEAEAVAVPEVAVAVGEDAEVVAVAAEALGAVVWEAVAEEAEAVAMPEVAVAVAEDDEVVALVEEKAMVVVAGKAEAESVAKVAEARAVPEVALAVAEDAEVVMVVAVVEEAPGAVVWEAAADDQVVAEEAEAIAVREVKVAVAEDDEVVAVVEKAMVAVVGKAEAELVAKVAESGAVPEVAVAVADVVVGVAVAEEAPVTVVGEAATEAKAVAVSMVVADDAEAVAMAEVVVPVAVPREAMAEDAKVVAAAGVAVELVEAQAEADEAPVAEIVVVHEEALAAVVDEAEAVMAERAFKILEMELAFVRDYFYTLYPMVFWQGLGSLCFSLLLSMATFAIALWLAVGIRKVYTPPEDTFMLWVGGWNVDVVITWVFMFFMMCKEVWEIVTYLISNWTRLLLVCKHVQRQFMRNAVMEKVTKSFYKSNIANPWHGLIDQYDFLQSCTYKPSFWKLANAITLGKTPEKFDGRKSGEAIKIPGCVKPAILHALCGLGLTDHQLPRKILPRKIPSLDSFPQYKWACLKLHTCSQVILVWHIATSLCEIKLAQDCEINLTRPRFLHSTWSKLKNFCCCTSQPYLVGDNIDRDDGLKTSYRIATSLSRYCAYLQAFQSGLLPDSFVVPDLIFEETLKDAREKLEHCNLIECRYSKLMVLAEEVARELQEVAPEVKQDSVDRKLTMKNIVQQGAILGKYLIEEENEEIRWKILAGVWADLLVHIAPSWNATDHKNNLESGGEFITLVWALLWHCGIEKSRLWEKDEAPESNAQVSQENKGSDIQPREEQPNEIESSEEPETSNFRRRRKRRNTQTDTVNQTQREVELTNITPPSSSMN